MVDLNNLYCPNENDTTAERAIITAELTCGMLKYLKENPGGGGTSASESQLVEISNIGTESLSGTARTQQEVNQEFTGAFINEKSEREAADVSINNDITAGLADLQKQIDEGAKKITTTLWPNDTVHLVPYAANTKKSYGISPSFLNDDYLVYRPHLTDVDTGKEYQSEYFINIKTLDFTKPLSYVVQNPDGSQGAFFIEFNSAGTQGTVWHVGVKWNSSTNHNANGFISLYSVRHSATYGSIADNQLQVNLNTNSIEDLYVRDGAQEARITALEANTGGLDQASLDWIAEAQGVYTVFSGTPHIKDRNGDDFISIDTSNDNLVLGIPLSGKYRKIRYLGEGTGALDAVALSQLPVVLGATTLEVNRIEQLEREINELRQLIKKLREDIIRGNI